MQIDWDAADKIFHLGAAAGAIGIAWVGLLLKNALGRMELNQARVKEELVAHQNEISADLARKHAENLRIGMKQEQALAVHIAEDKGDFSSLKGSLLRQDTILERLDNKLDAVLRNGH